MKADVSIGERLLDAWRTNSVPLAELEGDVRIYGDGVCSLVQAAEFGPPMGYGPTPRPDGHHNHGYKPLKRHPELVTDIPELNDWPEFRNLVMAINRSDGPTETLGCEKGFFPTKAGNATVYLGAYVDLLFSDLERNVAEEHVGLAAKLFEPMEDAASWWGSLEVSVQRMGGSAALRDRCSMMLRLYNHGRDEVEARKFWAHSSQLLERVFLSL